MNQIEKRIENIVEVLDSKKAENIEIFNLAGANYMADVVIIANSLGGKHTFALQDYLKEALKPKGESFLYIDLSDDWLVVDLGDIIIHVMSEEYREKYNIEEFLNELLAKKEKK